MRVWVCFILAAVLSIAIPACSETPSTGSETAQETNTGTPDANEQSTTPDTSTGNDTSTPTPDQSTTPDDNSQQDQTATPDQSTTPDQNTAPDQNAAPDNTPEQSNPPEQTTQPEATSQPDNMMPETTPEQTTPPEATSQPDSNPGTSDVVPTGNAALFAYLKAGKFKHFEKESKVRKAIAIHSAGARIFMNKALAASMKAGNSNHPKGAAVVKELYASDMKTLRGWAVMVKTGATSSGKNWYFYEVLSTTSSANPVADGNGVGLCAGCHSAGKDYIRIGYPLK